MNKLNINKIILKTSSITLLVLLAIFTIIFTGLSLFFPSVLAKNLSSLNFEKMALHYYEKAYDKSKDVNDLYKFLNYSITLGNSDNIIYSFELFYEDDEKYEKFIDYINNYYLTLSDDNLIKTTLVNEDARLKKAYVKALLNENKLDKAFLFSYNDLIKEEFNSIINYDNLNFTFFTYVGYLTQSEQENSVYSKFESFNVNNQTVSVISLINDYFENIKNIYDYNYFSREENEKSFELYLVSQHLVKVANTLLVLDDKLNSGIDTTNFNSYISDFYNQIDILKQEMLSQ